MARGGIRGWLAKVLGGGALAAARAEAQLAQSRLRDAIEALPEGVVFLDPEGRYILWNRRYAEIYHRSADLFRPGEKLIDTLREGVARGDYPDAVGREAEWLADREEKLATAAGERHEQLIADGRWLMIEERRTSDGGVIGLRVDITELKRQAAALEHALARAEAASRAKNEFLADMSHELRTPLNGVSGLASALGQTPLSDHQQALVADIQAGARRLETIINGLLLYGDTDLAPEHDSLAPPPRPSGGGGVRILLADDNPTNRKVIELMLATAAVEVVSVPNGAQAVDRWKTESFDLVLMDLRMPVMDGLTAIRTIRASEAEALRIRTPIVVLSANTSADDRRATEAAGADGHIGKPIRADELFGAIESVLEA
jgi:CheY-like chemotaxis protein